MGRPSSAKVWALLLSAVGLLSGCGKSTTERLGLPPLRAVPQVDLPRYMGRWYEIASYPQRFQAGCTGTTAQYALREDGDVQVVNRCFKGSLQGEEDVAEGRARVVDPAVPSRLEVSFFRPFWGDYWIISLAEDYSWAVVSHPGRDYLWILSRTPQMDSELLEAILKDLTGRGFERSRLQFTLQPQPGAPRAEAAPGE